MFFKFGISDFSDLVYVTVCVVLIGFFMSVGSVKEFFFGEEGGDDRSKSNHGSVLSVVSRFCGTC